MFKALIKKQLLATLAVFTQGKNGKRRSAAATIGFAVLILYAVGAIGFMFWEMAKMLCAPLVASGLGWVYFSVMGLMATGFGVIGSCFMAKSRLYEAKDNDLLLSMPIPAHTILFVRMLGLYLFTLMIEVLVLIPSMAQYYAVVGVQALSLLSGVLLILLLPLGSTALCCLIGFLLALLTAKMPFKNLVSVLGFVVFMVVYFLGYTKINEYISFVLTNGEAVGSTMKTVLYPFSQIGFAMEGNALSLLISVGIWGGLFALGYFIISLTYFRIITMKRGEYHAKYKERKGKQSGIVFTLFKKEFLRLIKSPMYLINASMGTLLMIIFSVMVWIKEDLFGLSAETLSMLVGEPNAMMLLVALVVCFMCSSNTLAACSVSLEGENISLLQAFPVDERSILRAKTYIHFVMTVLPALICALTMSLVLGLLWWEICLILLTAVIASLLFASFDLAVNLKFPNLQWTNEIVAVKQSISVVVAMFGSWGISLLPLGGYFLFGKYMPAWGYVILCLGLFTAITAALIVWLYKKGVKIFKSLSV
jgi:ABC-2 type transport system permease protein